MVRQGRCALVAVLCFFSMSAWAQVTIPEEYDKLIRHRGEVTAFGNDGFGDRVDIGSGGLEIVQTDIDLPGSNALPVRVARRFVPGSEHAGGHFGLWSLDIAHAYGVFSDNELNPVGWTVYGSGDEVYRRCSRYWAPLVIRYPVGNFEPDEYWHGNFFHLPGAGDEELLLAGASAHVPGDGNTYPVVTKGGAAVRCVALAATSESGSQGEGFEIVTSDGMIYTLNQMVSRDVAPILKPADQRVPTAAPRQTGRIQPMGAVTISLRRKEVILYPTKVTNRFGNFVTYAWSSTNPWQLQRMTASDGREITFAYDSASSSQIKSASDGTQTWLYAGSSDAYTVTRPDGSNWAFNLADLANFEMKPIGDGCYGEPRYIVTPPVVTGTIVAPTGATATFKMRPTKMGRSWVDRQCVFPDGSGEPIYAVEPIAYFNFSLIEKTVTGPGLPVSGLRWSYAYGASSGCWSVGGDEATCTVSSPVTRTVTVTDPEGDVARYTFGMHFARDEGLLLKTEQGWNGASALRVTDTTYAEPDAAPYSNYNGESPRKRGDVLTSSWKRPRLREVITQQGRSFIWQVASSCAGMPYCFDVYARPARIERSVSP